MASQPGFINKTGMSSGEELVSLIKKIFVEEEVPQDWLQCSVTLIPKVDEPETPSQYRPIGIGNVTYRLLMKLVANRLRPYMRNVISIEQNAFIKGRTISDNVILVKEVLHSFKQRGYHQLAFMLKADVSKAFDKLEWVFLARAMEYLNVPSKIINLMLSSYKRARVSININGKGDGFITPTRGLRQGCPMSPYGFIIAMEMLSRRLTKALREGKISGVKLAHTSPTITHLMYADDLILLGGTRHGELEQFIHILNQFADASGLMMNPEKSKLWLSAACGQETINRTTQLLQAAQAEGGDKYLGAIIQGGPTGMKTGRMLLDRMTKKLAGWKSHMLSHADRLVLIKSVLMSLPVYYMSIECIPKTLIRQMKSLMARFFWGKVGQSRYMAPLAWKTICKPIEEGGLAIRDMNFFGEALFMKMVWAVVSEENKLWVQVCKAKYCPQVGFWNAKPHSYCSRMWKDILHKRNFFKDTVRWSIGSGTSVKAIGQPWFHGWECQQTVPIAYKRKTVNELYDFDAQQWRLHELNVMFSQNQIMSIQAITPKMSSEGVEQDMMIWEQAKRGKYTVKEGYQLLSRQENLSGSNNVAELWQKVKTWKGVVPKVKIFIWRLISKALMLSQNVHRRISTVAAMCQRCQGENEYEMHYFFYCPGSRVVWFGSKLGLRSEELPLNVVTAIEQCTQNMTVEEIRRYCYTLWEIWIARNEMIMQHKKFEPVQILKKVQYWMEKGIDQPGLEIAAKVKEKVQHEPYWYRHNTYQIIADGSWDVQNKAGCAYLLYYDGQLLKIGYSSHTLYDPYQAEVCAMKEALIRLHQRSIQNHEIEVFSDCSTLVAILNEGDMEEVPSWRAWQDTVELMRISNQYEGALLVQHVRRDAVHEAHLLANLARRAGKRYVGIPRSWHDGEKEIGELIDFRFFQKGAV
ncbi:RNA-directed DNA polymerase (reverse transcriptase)-related family protein [Rhynchospora pubera]|uniref:RNA-directed DNA polymerase (Reverse transcriptase)-related family protein n=1 Tax=Rhynchospora pubera TaxID=906938 RepID=A0AAV8BPZ4_9POAL|nr:RNA-directed DNA polymerase (reverse transcriptase)-related family protein [Rhynchospora pubera]